MNDFIQKIDHLVITTANVEECVNFYQKLDFKAREAGGRYELYAGDFKINVHVLRHELSPHALNVQVGSADLCFETNLGLEELKQHLINQGLSLESDIVIRHGVKGSMKSIYLRDPEGNLIEFCKYD